MVSFVYGLEHFYSVPNCLGDLHTFLQTFGEDTNVTILGHGAVPSEAYGELIFIRITEDKDTDLWQLVSLTAHGHKVVRTYLRDTLPVKGQISGVRVSYLITEIRLFFIQENTSLPEVEVRLVL